MGKGTRAVQRMLEATGDKLFATCVWCQKRLVWIQKLPKDSILNMRWNGEHPSPRVIYLLDGKKCTDLIVTVDHLKEISKGGTNYYTNLVLSCAPCNSHRSNVRTHFYPNCVQCGKAKNGNKKRCSQCISENRERILKEKGIWDETRRKQPRPEPTDAGSS